MKEIILEVLKNIAECDGNDCQINLGSESAQEMIAFALDKELNKYVQQLVEDIICGISYSVKYDSETGM